MPKALRPFRHEEIFSGEFVWLLTQVEMGHDGFKNLIHFVPLAQNDWQLFQSGSGHILTNEFDPATSRDLARQTATVAAARTSFLRKRIILPQDFGQFDTGAIVFITRRSASAPTSYQATLLKGGVADPGINGVNVQAATTAFELKTLTPTATYFPGDLVTLELECITGGNLQFNEIGDLEIQYRTARGNVL